MRSALAPLTISSKTRSQPAAYNASRYKFRLWSLIHGRNRSAWRLVQLITKTQYSWTLNIGKGLWIFVVLEMAVARRPHSGVQ